MNRVISLTCARYPSLGLRTIQDHDQEHLRTWKNAHRERFFHQELISAADQQGWFAAYRAREHDFMFVVSLAYTDLGCMGFRLRGESWDIYNVILGNPTFSKAGFMGQALHMMCSYAITQQPLRITAQVLNTNPALHWYYRNAFRAAAVRADHTEIELDKTVFTPCTLVEAFLTGVE